jgi:pyruvate formate lyase activating enzyme
MLGGFVGVGGWLENSFIDYPGTVAAVLFFSGCNLRCPYCHNPSLARGDFAEQVAPERIRAFLRQRRGLIEGVVLSGGEPTIHASLPSSASEARELGYRVKLDTNGLLPEALGLVAPDYLALDIKTRPGLYGPVLGAPYRDVAERLERSVAVARAMGERAEVRVTVAPGCIDDQAVEEIALLVSGVRRVYLQPMTQRHPLLDPAYNTLPLPSREDLARYREMLGRSVGECSVRGE